MAEHAFRADPLIVIPARFSESAIGAALPRRGDAPARSSSACTPPAASRSSCTPALRAASPTSTPSASGCPFADGVLLPGGGDLRPAGPASNHHPSHYDVDEEQDAFDLAVARVALEAGICRCWPSAAGSRSSTSRSAASGRRTWTTTRRGGHHRHRVHDIAVRRGLAARQTIVGREPRDLVLPPPVHRPARRRAASRGARRGRGHRGGRDCTAAGWFLGVQWHPEDTAATDPGQAAVFEARSMPPGRVDAYCVGRSLRRP